MAIIDLCAGGIGMRATRFSERSATAPVWADRSGVDLAINGDFFEYGSYFVAHRARGGGEAWPPGTTHVEPSPYAYFGAGLAGIDSSDAEPGIGITDIVGGSTDMIVGGRIMYDWGPDPSGFLYGGHRRTAVGFSANRRTLFLMASDLSVSIPRMAEIMVEHQRWAGAPPIDMAINLDGGGSTQMFLRGAGSLIGSTRAVSNHIGVYFGGGGVNACPRSPFCPPGGAADVCLPDGQLGHCVDGFIERSEPCEHGCRNLPAPQADRCWQLPRGTFDVAQCDELRGWAQDPNTPDAANEVHVYIDGPAGSGARMIRATADDVRSDLCGAIGSCAHGFSIPTPSDLRDGREHTLYAYSVSTVGAPQNPMIANSPRTVRCPVARVADFDGDGRADIMEYRSDWRSVPVCRSTGTGWSCRNLPAEFAATAERPAASAIVDGSEPLVMHFDRDVRADLVQVHADRNVTPVCSSTSTGWACRSMPLTSSNNRFDLADEDPAAGRGGVALAADFNHDGLSDLIRFRADSEAIPVCLSTGSGWSCRNLRAHYVGGDEGPGRNGSAVYGGTAVVGDFDGDGYADLAQFRSSERTIPLCRSTGAGWSCRNLRAHHAGGELRPGNDGSGIWAGSIPILGDFNGDGRSDLAQFRDDGTDALPVCLSLQTGWSCRGLRAIGAGLRDTRNASGGPIRPGITPLVSDFDGDGRDEIVLYHSHRTTVAVCRFLEGWSCRLLAASFAGGDLGAGNDGSGIYRGATALIADFDGDHRGDLLQFQSQGWQGIPVCLSTGAGWNCRNLFAHYVGGLGPGNGGSGVYP